MTTFEQDHPRGQAGKFTVKDRTIPDAELYSEDDEAADAAFEALCTQADELMAQADEAGVDATDLDDSIDSGDPETIRDGIRRLRARLHPDFAEQVDTADRAVLECALWSSSDWTSGEPLDGAYGVDDFDAATAAQLRADTDAFIADNHEALSRVIDASGGSYDWSNVGHDFWLTRNGHGAGFWDRGFGEDGKALSEAAHAYGAMDLYAGDDGRIYG